MNTWNRSCKFALLSLLLFLLLLAGCGPPPSLHPLYTDRDLIFDPALLGVWVSPDGQTSTFARKGLTEYSIETTGQDESHKPVSSKYDAHLLLVKGVKFLDLSVPADAGWGDFSPGCLVPAHIFLHILQTEPILRVSFCDDEWLEKFLKTNGRAVRHETMQEGDQSYTVLTASPADLQRFLLAHLSTKGAFVETDILTRPKK